jgi:catechol 2,3-dioxygenase-like lactoylglutathione lyase family enzyme
MIKHIDHVTIAVTNLEESKKFFELFGFKEMISVVISGEKVAKYMNIPNIESDHVTLVHETAKPRFEIQLLRFHRPIAQSDSNIHRLDKIGYNHICFAVDNIENEVKRLQKSGVKFLNEIMNFHSRKLIYLEGPDGITMELAQWNNTEEDPNFS